MTTTYEPVPGRLAEVIAYLMVRRFNRLSGAAGNYEQGQALYSEYRTDATVFACIAATVPNPAPSSNRRGGVALEPCLPMPWKHAYGTRSSR